jgi:hypothetical protein
MAKYEDLTGKKFNMLEVLTATDTKVNKMPGWLCKCDCGGEKIVARYHLTTGVVSSCGCLSKYDNKTFKNVAIKVHGDFYDYSKVDYTHSQSFVTIGCPIHGEFEQRPTIHLSGSGCQECSGIRMGMAQTVPAEEFELRAKEIRTDFSYDLQNYVNLTTPMTFVCNTHGTPHEQKPSAYLSGNNACMACRGRINNGESFIKKANEIHGVGRYDYSLVEYTTSKKNVVITCSVGHLFEQTPHNHTAGKHGCPSCGPCGFDARKDSWIYVLSSSGISKVGITNRSAKIRAKLISKSADKEFKVEAEYKLEGQFCSDLESKLLRHYRLNYQNPALLFRGSSECFMGLSAEVIKSDISRSIEKHYDN